MLDCGYLNKLFKVCQMLIVKNKLLKNKLLHQRHMLLFDIVIKWVLRPIVMVSSMKKWVSWQHVDLFIL